MHLNVIGMAVAPVGVVDGQYIGVDVDEDRGQTLRRLFDIGLPETRRILVGRFADHAGVFVTEELGPMHSEDVGRQLGFDDTPLPERFALGQNAGLRLALFTARRGDEHHGVTGLRSEEHRAPGCDRFVIGMRMETHESGHVCSLRASGDCAYRPQ